MTAAALRASVRTDRLTLTIGAALLIAALVSWAIVLKANAAMDDAPAALPGLDSAMDEGDPGAATNPMDDAGGDAMAAMSPREDLRMRIGVSRQMDSWAWPATFAVFAGGWMAMMAAMMFPAATPMVSMYARSARKRYSPSKSAALIATFVLGYIVIWGVFGVAAYAINEAAGEASTHWDSVLDAGPYVGGVLLIGAGIYQLSPLKQLCLAQCRSPFSFLMHHWHDGATGAVRMGVRHGLWCLGCCVGLMVGLIVAGVMSIGWMVTLGVLIFAEKVTRWGPQVARVTAAAMVAGGIGLMVFGEDLPGIV